jgi:Flp pilus assembly protein TadG
MAMLDRIRRFLRCQNGNVAVIVCLAAVPLMLAAGVAVDFVRLQQARMALQASLDSAALAAAKKESAETSNIQQLVSSYLNQNKPSGLLLVNTNATVVNNGASTPSASDDFKSVVYTADASLDTTVMKAVGINSVDFRVTSEATVATVPRMDIALVVDISSSMTGSKLTALRTAAKNLINSVMIYPTADDIVRVGVVPYTQYVRMPTAAAGSWFNIPAPVTIPCHCFWAVPPTCVLVPGTCDGLPCQVNQCSGGQMQCNVGPKSWSGCIGVRPEAFHDSISFSSSTPNYTGPIHCNPTDCGPTLTDLTTDKTELINMIDNNLRFQPSASMGEGGTYIPGGLIWGWNMLRPSEPLTNARDPAFMSQTGGRRVMLVMTDGTNSYSPLNQTGPTVVVNSSSYYRNRGSNTSYAPSYADDRTKVLCNGIKDDGIKIYSIAFNVTDPTTKDLLRDCAGPAAPGEIVYYDAISSQDLINAFADIVKQLQTVKIIN